MFISNTLPYTRVRNKLMFGFNTCVITPRSCTYPFSTYSVFVYIHTYIHTYTQQYVTNSELGFDYLRDNLALTPADIVLGRPLNMCIVDEADSIMIDEARTPLIISEKTAAPVAKYANSAKIAAVLQEKVHYTVDERSQSVVLTERGFADVEKILNVQDLFNPRDPWSTYIINALKAKSLFKKDVQVHCTCMDAFCIY
jgi:preprotein translocase subunit SecA